MNLHLPYRIASGLLIAGVVLLASAGRLFAEPLSTDDGYRGNQRGDHVWRLPTKMDGDFAKPDVAW